MQRIIPTVLFFCLFTMVNAETISLKGTVKKTDGAGIAGVKVSLAKVPGLSTTTGTDGAFTLSGSTSPVLLRNRNIEPVQFMIKGNAIIFAPTTHGISASVDVFSSDGKVKSSNRLSDLSGSREIALPRLSSGINLMKVTIDGESFMRTLVCVGNELFLKNELASVKNTDKLILAKQLSAAAVDTLKAEKDGYAAKKFPLQKYSQENIALSLDSNGGTGGKCTRDALIAIAEKYVAAQKAGDPSKMPLAPSVKYIQNLKSTTEDKSICKTAMPVDTSRIFVDTDSCLTFVEIISSTGTPPYVLLTWLKVAGSQITEINAMVTTTGDWLFDAAGYLKYSKPQDWSILPDSLRTPRQQLINGANAYLDAFVPKTKSDTIPWGVPCERIEGGTSTGSGPKATCNVGVPDGVKITDRKYAVDVEKGVVDVFCAFGGGMPDSHMFKMIKGKYRYVHTLSVQN